MGTAWKNLISIVLRSNKKKRKEKKTTIANSLHRPIIIAIFYFIIANALGKIKFRLKIRYSFIQTPPTTTGHFGALRVLLLWWRNY